MSPTHEAQAAVPTGGVCAQTGVKSQPNPKEK